MGLMDYYINKLKRRWHANPGEHEMHARLITTGMRLKELDYDKVSLIALWGHKGARLALGPDVIKGEKLIYMDELISFAELHNVVASSSVYPIESLRLIITAIYNLCYNAIEQEAENGSQNDRIVSLYNSIRQYNMGLFVGGLKWEREICVSFMWATIALFKDEEIYNTVRSKLYPWALKEYI